jgi:hypothetical protein
MERTVYLVKTKHGFVGTRRYNYSDGTYSPEVGFERARLYARLSDAEGACEHGDTVVEATVRLVMVGG